MARANTFSPPNLPFQRLNITALVFISGFILWAEDKHPVEELTEIVSRDELKNLVDRLEEKQKAKRLAELSKEDLLLIYASHDLMSQLLLTGAGEEHSALILEELTPDALLKNFDDYRSYYLRLNAHVLADIEKLLGKDRELAALKRVLNGVVTHFE